MRQNGEGYVVPMTTRQDGALEASWCDVWDLKEATVFSFECISNFLIFGFYYLFSYAGIFIRLLLIAQHLHSRLGMEMCSPHYFATLMCSAFNIWWLRSGKKKIKNYLYFYKYDSIMTGYICRHFHARCMLKLSPKFQAVSCVSTRGGVWCGSEGCERTAELVSLGCLFGWLCGCRNDRGL